MGAGRRRGWGFTVAAVGLALMAGAGARAAAIDPELETELAALAPQEEVAVILRLADRVNHRLHETKDRTRRDSRLFRALRAKAKQTQGTHLSFLQSQGARRLRELWLINGIAATLPAGVVRALAARPGVERIGPDSQLAAPGAAPAAAAPPEWNLNAVHAPALWTLGHTGAGVVVANMDTGVDGEHPDLKAKWRGDAGSWYDPHGEHVIPYDVHGHGTQTMGILAGGAAGGTAIGVAPDARWIAAKIYNDAGQATYSDIHLAFQWLLDPDGDPNTLDAPDVVNASWGLVGSAGQCITEFDLDIDALKTAGIAVAFAAGNDGPAPLTSLSPANHPGALATGAVDDTLTIASFSSRGPSACDGTIYPKLVAPGVSVNTADLSFGGLLLYAIVSGTSFAAPHTAGLMALLAGAFPQASVAQIESALQASAQDLGVAGEDNAYGYGLADGQAAYQALLGAPPVITSAPVVDAVEDSLYGYAVAANDPDGDAISFSLTAGPVGMTIDYSTGAISWVPTNSQVGTHAVTVRATDAGGLFSEQPYNVTVANVNDPPVAVKDVYAMIAGTTLGIAAPGVLANDTDVDGDALTVRGYGNPANGTLAIDAGGAFSYTPNAGYTGTDTFWYTAQDPSGARSNSVTVFLKVSANRPPVAKNDSKLVPARLGSRYVARIFTVLVNDKDPDTAIDAANLIDPATVAIVAVPGMGGTATVNGDGTVSYMPALGFRGTESFGYTVNDTLGATSNTATVTVTVD